MTREWDKVLSCLHSVIFWNLISPAHCKHSKSKNELRYFWLSHCFLPLTSYERLFAVIAIPCTQLFRVYEMSLFLVEKLEAGLSTTLWPGRKCSIESWTHHKTHKLYLQPPCLVPHGSLPTAPLPLSQQRHQVSGRKMNSRNEEVGKCSRKKITKGDTSRNSTSSLQNMGCINVD